jgi:hydroxyethylthiazole kinase-like uncharacterized protein yjeF
MPQSTELTSVTPDMLRDWELPTAAGSKYSRGQVVVVGGAARSPGAALLAGEAALRVGSGRLTLAVAASVATGIAIALPECGVVGLDETDDDHIRGDGIAVAKPDLADADAVLVGPGLDDPMQSTELVRQVPGLIGRHTVVVLDAFALGILTNLRAEIEPLAGRLVLTPNVEEAGRLTDRRVGDLHEALADIATTYGAVVSCQNLIVASNGDSWSMGTGTVGLATSGSGDILAGAIAGICARSATPAQAAVWGTYLHATAGDTLATRLGPVGFLARELLPELPVLLDRLRPQ